MRKQLCDALLARSRDPAMVFLTGDLGFMALEPLRAAMGARFINAGVAEQNMISVAAAMAREGLSPWIYSIAPFCYARPFEQIRNDVAFHRLPVKLIGNGGGYGYGVMGATHHAIEDYGVLLTLPHMEVYTPVFDEDVEAVVALAGASTKASYLRLGRGEAPSDYTVPAFAPWRQLVEGDGIPVLAVGPLAGCYIPALRGIETSRRPSLWAVGRLPVEPDAVPEAVWRAIARHRRLCVAEEHVRQGGFGADFALHVLERGMEGVRLHHLFARAHHYERSGSQAWLRRQSRLDAESLLVELGLKF